MNHDQVKENLLKIRDDVTDFSVIFSGKTSRKIDGLYHTEKQEIIIHNKNFSNNNSLMYTAIHEFAHHIQFSENEDQKTNNSHNQLFWGIFHKLLRTAENCGVYENVLVTDHRFIDLTKTIKEKYLAVNGNIMKDFGKLLIQALDLCQQNHVSFEDFVDRSLSMTRSSVKKIMKVYAMDVDPEIGFDNMKIVSQVKDPQKRKEMEDAFKEGQSQNEVKESFKGEEKNSGYDLKKLISQKKRLEKSIQAMQQKLAYLEAEIEGAE